MPHTADGTPLSHAVLIAGGGPTGLMLAGELALAGIDVAIVERRPTPDLIGMRSRGLHARSLEVLDQRGVADRFVSQGQRYPFVHFHEVALDVSDCPTRHNCTLGLAQQHVERLLAQWVSELGVPVHRGREVSGFAQDESGVDVSLSDGTSMRASYLVGCDGGRSVVRKAAGIAFTGSDPTTSWLIAEFETTEEPRWGFHRDADGIHAMGPGAKNGSVGVVLAERQLHVDDSPTLDDVRQALVAVYGTDFGARNATWLSRFTDATRLAATCRDRRVLLAGDAAHVHPPIGGQGLNMGLQDAVNVGWKLAQVIAGTSPDALLDTYHAERHPVAARVLRTTMAQVALRRQDDRSKALAETVSALLRLDEPRRRVAAEVAGLDIRYDFGEGHPLLGRRMPDLDLVTADGPRRVFALLHRARPVLIDFAPARSTEMERSSAPERSNEMERSSAPGRSNETERSTASERSNFSWTVPATVLVVAAEYTDPWELPAIGRVPAPTAVLVRPDGYVAWVGEGTQDGLAEALTRWCGAPSSSITHGGRGFSLGRAVSQQ
jgi:3-(3-hydroxy-phenyl)propionate hydroxylase